MTAPTPVRQRIQIFERAKSISVKKTLAERAPVIKRLRVLHIYKDVYPPVMGGIENHIHDVTTGLKDRFDFKILTAWDRPVTQWDAIQGVPVCKAATWGRLAAAPVCPTFPWLLKKLSREADIIHHHLPNPTGVMAHLMARCRETALVVTYHSDIVRQKHFLPLYAPFLRRFLSRADLIMPTSEAYMRSSPFLAPVSRQCRPTPLGIDTSAYAPTESIQRMAKGLRAKYGGIGRPLLGFVGRLRAYKGLEFLIESLSNLEVHGARLLIVGEGPMQKELEDRARCWGLSNRVIFLGTLSETEKVAFLHAIDVYCLPSHLRSEAFGLSQIEAMACGKPVVSCRLDSGVPFVNLDGVTGLTVAPGVAWSLAEALNRLLGNPDLARRLGEAGRMRARQMFDRRAMLERIARAYGDIARK